VRILLVTEKANAAPEQRDGGARLVSTLRRAFGDSIDVLQFGGIVTGCDRWQVEYPFKIRCRFERRLANADFIGEQVRARLAGHTHVIFVHLSMQFCFATCKLDGPQVWTMPMFLTPSYVASGEDVPAAYTERERLTLLASDHILTPSRLERQQLIEQYGVDPARIRVVPRGVDQQVAQVRIRKNQGPLLLCSIGSIKPQKNTVGLVRLFAAVRQRIPGATLRIIGPVQDRAYWELVERELKACDVSDYVEFSGHVSPDELARVTADCHIHVSASNCETFGRAIFESLALGLPNIVRRHQNAALEQLAGRHYVRSFNTEGEGADAICAMLSSLESASEHAVEIGDLFGDDLLATRLVAELAGATSLAVSDFDGTLFHKAEPDRTRRSVAAFMRYQRRVVCSARALPDLLGQMAEIGVTADFVVALGGATIATGAGKVLHQVVLDPRIVERVQRTMPSAKARIEGKSVTQFSIPHGDLVSLEGLRVETYQDTSYIAAWSASKLHATVWVLRHIDWRGRVRAFGDGRYDEELLQYFDGTRITLQPNPVSPIREASEVTHDAV
jgi:glycosyltransferase involved in cell wall biosynthesis